MSRGLAPGQAWAIGASLASGHAKAEVRTGKAVHERQAPEDRRAFITLRTPDGAEVTRAFDRIELTLFRDALTDALRWVR